MIRSWTLSLCVLVALCFEGCGSKRGSSETGDTSKPQEVAVSTAVAESRTVPASFLETGSFVADESSDIAPPVAGRVIATPVDVGAFVKEGQVVCELDHRDAQLKLQQAKAQLDEATASVRQAQSRIGLTGGTFDPDKVPEVAACEGQLCFRGGTSQNGRSGFATLRKPDCDGRCFPERL